MQIGLLAYSSFGLPGAGIFSILMTVVIVYILAKFSSRFKKDKEGKPDNTRNRRNYWLIPDVLFLGLALFGLGGIFQSLIGYIQNRNALEIYFAPPDILVHGVSIVFVIWSVFALSLSGAYLMIKEIVS